MVTWVPDTAVTTAVHSDRAPKSVTTVSPALSLDSTAAPAVEEDDDDDNDDGDVDDENNFSSSSLRRVYTNVSASFWEAQSLIAGHISELNR